MQENAEYKALGSLETNVLLSWKHKIAGEVKNKTIQTVQQISL